MNKLIIENKEHNLDNFCGEIAFNNDLILNVSGSCELLVTKLNANLEINLKDNAYLNVIFCDNNKMASNNITIKQNNNTNLHFKDLFEAIADVKLNVYIELLGDNNYANVDIACVASKGNSIILEQIHALDGCKNNDATERVRGLISGGNITVLPNMLIDSNEVVANHFVTISSYNKDVLFYLESKGLKEETAKELIKQSYLYY